MVFSARWSDYLGGHISRFHCIVATFIMHVQQACFILGEGADPSRPKCRKAKELRRERWALKHGNKAQIEKLQSHHNEAKTLEQFLGEISDNPAHRLEVMVMHSKCISIIDI